MFERLAYAQMEEWYNSNLKGKKKALLVTGARQIGKSFLVRHLGQQKYERFIEINLIKDYAARNALSDASGLTDFLSRISLFASGPLVEGRTLIFIDEIQEAPNLITMAKFIAEDGRFDIAYSGSLLGVQLKRVRSFPVGSVSEIKMYPMTFLEFCWAMDVSSEALETVRQACLDGVSVPDYLHDALMRYFRSYIVVGGMPDAVQAFVDTKGDFAATRKVQSELNDGYVSDITKYAGKRELDVKQIFEALPVQLDGDSRRFVLASIDPSARYERYKQDFAWLTDAGVALKDDLVREPKSPLKAVERNGYFKLYQSDVGMLLSRYDAKVALDAYTASGNTNLDSVYENVLAQEMTACGFDLNYYMTKKRGEVDFVVESSAYGIVALEAKSGRYPRAHAALNNVLASEEYDINLGVVFCPLNVEVDGAVTYLPWYAVLCLQDLINPQPQLPKAHLPRI